MRVTIYKCVAVGMAAVLSAALSTLGAAPAQAKTAGKGYVRLAHLSPDTPNVDVYLSAQSGPAQEKVFGGVGYGAMTTYQTLDPGGYTVAMRWQGAPKTDLPVLTTHVSVTAGGAFTVAGVGPRAGVSLKILQDDLSLNDPSKAKVRIIQASVQAPVLNVSLTNGPSIAQNVSFATTTAYHMVNPGSWQLKVQPATGGSPTNLSTSLKSGHVYSLLILDAPDNTLKPQLMRDAGSQGVPFGGLATGGGGTAGQGVPIYLVIGAVALIVAVATGLVLTVRNRRRSTVL